MMPYFSLTTIALGPLTIQAWGLMVAVGIIIGLLLILKLGRIQNLSKDILLDFFIWTLVGGIIFARIFHVLIYYPKYYFGNPVEILKIWNGGVSSLGGFIGAFFVAFIIIKIHKLKIKDFLKYADVLVIGFWLGWAIGRIGCFFIHDHLGHLTNFFLAVNFPNGARHDLGLYEVFLALIIFILCISLYKKYKEKVGAILFGSFIFYSFFRFFLDFLRAKDFIGADPRYYYLTPAQWGVGIIFIALTGISIFVNVKQKNKKGEIA